MKPINFIGTNVIYRAPEGTEDWCGDLHCLQKNNGITSMWQPSDEERAAIAAGAPIQLTVHAAILPPVALAVGQVLKADRDPARCGVCGWPLNEPDAACKRGDCSLRPMPPEKEWYDADRYHKEQHR